jgi:signal transduction histidine kinase
LRNARHAAEVAELEERQRLAPDLHDSAGAMLRLTAGVGSLGKHFGALPEVLQRIETIEGQVLEAAQMLRQSLRALPSSPEGVALPVTLRSGARRLTQAPLTQ